MLHLKMDQILHDHSYSCFQHGGNSPDNQGEVKPKRKSLRDASHCSSNDLIDGLPDGYINNTVNSRCYNSNQCFSSGKRKLSLFNSPPNGTSTKSRKGNKIHELLFGESGDPPYVDGVQIPDTQTVASEEGKSITTSDFGLYINNPSTYSSMSSEDTRFLLTRPERLAIFGSSMSVDSETEILEAASTLMDLARNSVIPKQERFRKNKVKIEKVKRNNILKPKPMDVKIQKRKYTKRKGSKKDNVKETYSLWTNGNKYDEFEYYATKPLHRSQCTLSSRKSSYRRSNEPKGDKKRDTENMKMNGDVKEENDEAVDFNDTKWSEAKLKVKKKRKLSQNRVPKPKSKPKDENELSTSWEETLRKPPIKVKKSSKKASVKSKKKSAKNPPSVGSPIASSSAMTLPEPDVTEGKEEEKAVDGDTYNGLDSDADVVDVTTVKLAQSQSLTHRPIQRRGKRKSFGSDDDQANSDGVQYMPIKFQPHTTAHEARSMDPWGQALPPNILIQIFTIAVRDNGVAPFLSRVSSVCRLWNSVASDLSLWRMCNLSGNAVRKLKKTFRWLCKHRMMKVRVLNLANWEVLTYKEIELLGMNAPLIESLNLSRCSRITPSSLRGLIDSLQYLKHLDISFATTFIASKIVLEQLIQKRGPQLVTLNCSYNILVKFDTVMTGIIKSCRNLQVLDLSNAIFSSCLLPLNIEQLQIGCPLLRKLLMANSLFKAKPVWGASPGFEHMEELNVARSAVSHLSKFRYVDDSVLHRFLRTSRRLKVLDVSGCRYISNTGLQELDIPNLESLSLSYCRASVQQEIEQTIIRWSHSLKKLDFSGNSMNNRLMRCILLHCTKLELLNLSGCKGLPWDKRHEFNGLELVQLRDTMDSWLE